MDVCLGSAPGPPPWASPNPEPLAQAPTWHSVLSLPLSPLPDLEQRILQVLKKADTPVKAAQLAKECQAPKKNINRVLYRMKDKLLVDDAGSATWCLREGGTGEMVPTAPAQPSHGNLPTLGRGRAGGGDPAPAVLATDKPGFGPGCEYRLCPSGVHTVSSSCLTSSSGQRRQEPGCFVGFPED